MTPASRTNFELVKLFYKLNGRPPSREALYCPMERHLGGWLRGAVSGHHKSRHYPEVKEWYEKHKRHRGFIALKRPVIDPETGIQYESLTAAGKALGITTSSVQYRLEKGRMLYASARPPRRTLGKEWR